MIQKRRERKIKKKKKKERVKKGNDVCTAPNFFAHQLTWSFKHTWGLIKSFIVTKVNYLT